MRKDRTYTYLKLNVMLHRNRKYIKIFVLLFITVVVNTNPKKKLQHRIKVWHVNNYMV